MSALTVSKQEGPDGASRDGKPTPSADTGVQKPVFGVRGVTGPAAAAAGFGRAATVSRASHHRPEGSGHNVIRVEVLKGELPSDALLSDKGMVPATPFQNPAWMRA